MMDLEAARRGDENVSTPREMARLAEIVARGESLSPARATDILAVASVPDGRSQFRRGLPAGVKAVSKPGALEGVRCEAAWVDVPGRPYAAAIMTTYLRREADGEAAIASSPLRSTTPSTAWPAPPRTAASSATESPPSSQRTPTGRASPAMAGVEGRASVRSPLACESPTDRTPGARSSPRDPTRRPSRGSVAHSGGPSPPSGAGPAMNAAVATGSSRGFGHGLPVLADELPVFPMGCGRVSTGPPRTADSFRNG